MSVKLFIDNLKGRLNESPIIYRLVSGSFWSLIGAGGGHDCFRWRLIYLSPGSLEKKILEYLG